MKLKVKRAFQYQATPQKVKEIKPGMYSVPGDISRELAEKIRKYGKAEVIEEVFQKQAPENKIAQVPETKKKVSKRRRRSTRTEPDA